MRDITDKFKESNTQKVEILEEEKRHDLKKKKKSKKQRTMERKFPELNKYLTF